MDFNEVVNRRYSCRGYEPRPVEEARLQRILAAVQKAPSACNRQPYRFLVVTQAELRASISAVYPKPWLAQAPVIVVALGQREQAWKRLDGTSAHVIDTVIAMEHLVLAAANEGLATCWICAFDQVEMHRCLALGPEWDVVAITPLGHPADPGRGTPRKPIAEIVEFIR
jgi:nitroreductase